MINLQDVSVIYNEETAFEKKALDKINLKVEKGEFVGLIGHTGSGKSTLLQLLNGLLLPTSGKVSIDELYTNEKSNLKSIRKKVGLVFQYPEYQLFEETVEKDISYAPLNYGLKGEEVIERVKFAMDLSGLDFEEYRNRSPFELSGGEKRRVALAGVLASKPEYLILDEPTAGLDPAGREELLNELTRIRNNENITILLVSHSMDDIAKVADRILILKDGKLASDKSVKETFVDEEFMNEMGLSIPEITKFMKMYKAKGHNVRTDIFTVQEAMKEIVREKNA